jgi:toxin ParE1/3/4
MNVRMTPRAHAQLRSALDTIASHSPAGARRVSRRLEHALGLLADFPYLGRPGAEPGTRELVVARTPYIIIYIVGEEIEVVSILHGRQNRPV